MSTIISLISAACYDADPPQVGYGIQVGFQKRSPTVGPVGVSKTEIDGQRQLMLCGKANGKIHCLHQLRCAWKSHRSGCTEFDNQKGGLIGNTAVDNLYTTVSGCNSGYMGSVSTGVKTGTE